MKALKTILFIITLLCTVIATQAQQMKLGLLVYGGGGDWYANPTSLPNLIKFCNQNLRTSIQPTEVDIDAGNKDIFELPFIHMTGHGNVIFSGEEVKNLRKYLMAGGFLHIDDNYGLDQYARREMKKVFPELDFVELPFSHPIYHQKYDFKDGLPKIHEHDGKPPQGFGLIWEGRLVCFYTYECDLGDGWEDTEVHHDSEAKHQEALKMGANIISYCFTKQ